MVSPSKDNYWAEFIAVSINIVIVYIDWMRQSISVAIDASAVENGNEVEPNTHTVW